MGTILGSQRGLGRQERRAHYACKEVRREGRLEVGGRSPVEMASQELRSEEGRDHEGVRPQWRGSRAVQSRNATVKGEAAWRVSLPKEEGLSSPQGTKMSADRF